MVFGLEDVVHTVHAAKAKAETSRVDAAYEVFSRVLWVMTPCADVLRDLHARLNNNRPIDWDGIEQQVREAYWAQGGARGCAVTSPHEYEPFEKVLQALHDARIGWGPATENSSTAPCTAYGGRGPPVSCSCPECAPAAGRTTTKSGRASSTRCARRTGLLLRFELARCVAHTARGRRPVIARQRGLSVVLGDLDLLGL